MKAMIGCPYCGATIEQQRDACPRCGMSTRSAPAKVAENAERLLLDTLTLPQRRIFEAQMLQARKNETTGVVLAILLGGFGAHHFYLGSAVMGAIYVLFCWTFVPAVLALIEAFFMPGRVRAYNTRQALEIAARISSLPQTPSDTEP